MAERHPSAADLEGYVTGSLAAAEAAGVEAHAAACAACSDALTREARLELALREVARSPGAQRRPIDPGWARARDRKRRAAVAGAVVVAAAAAMLLVPRDRGPEVVGPREQARSARLDRAPRTADAVRPHAGAVACGDSDETERCVRDAHRRGRAVLYPTIEVPLYEHAAADQLR